MYVATHYIVIIYELNNSSKASPVLLTLDVSGNASTDTVTVKNVNFYKEIEWSVHSVKDYTDEYMCLECVRTVGKRQSIRRAYG